MSQLNCVGCEKQNVHSQTCTKFLRFLLVFMYFRNKFSKKKKKKPSKYRQNLSVVLVLNTNSFPVYLSTAF